MKVAPEAVVKKVHSWFVIDDSLFQYKGGQLLSNIFPNFAPEIQAPLLSTITGGNKDELRFVIACLRAYDGQEFLFNFCRELVRICPEDDDLLGEITVPLWATGFVRVRPESLCV